MGSRQWYFLWIEFKHVKIQLKCSNWQPTLLSYVGRRDDGSESVRCERLCVQFPHKHLTELPRRDLSEKKKHTRRDKIKKLKEKTKRLTSRPYHVSAHRIISNRATRSLHSSLLLPPLHSNPNYPANLRPPHPTPLPPPSSPRPKNVQGRFRFPFKQLWRRAFLGRAGYSRNELWFFWLGSTLLCNLPLCPQRNFNFRPRPPCLGWERP
mgnify:CR=1 FL=1